MGEMSQRDMETAIRNLVERNYSDEVIELARADMKYGLSMKELDWYLDSKKLDVEQAKQISRALRSHLDTDFLEVLTGSGFNSHQMKVLVDYASKGLPLAVLKDNINKGMPAHAMDKALREVFAALQEAERSAQTEPEYAKKVQKQITEIVEGIGQNKTFLEAVTKKLSSLEQVQRGSDDVRESLAKSLEDKEQIILQQQEQNNFLARQNAELRGNLEKLQKESGKIQEEKEDLERKISELERQIEELKKDSNSANVSASQMAGNEMPAEAGTVGDYHAAVTDKQGKQTVLTVERTKRKKPEGLLAMAGKKLFGGNKAMNLIKHLTGKGLNHAQMEQVRIAIESGLEENEVIDIINSGFTAEEMAQAIQIVMADKAYQ